MTSPSPKVESSTWPEIAIDNDCRDYWKEIMRHMAQSPPMPTYLGAGYGAAAGVDTPAQNRAYYSNEQKLMMRLNVPNINELPFKGLSVVANPGKQEIVVFFIYNDQPMYMTDGEALFPSDALIGKLNLMR